MKKQTDKSVQDRVRKLKVEARRAMIEQEAEHQFRLMGFKNLTDLPDYLPDEKNPDVLVRGRWLERGGSAWIVSTSGTGKSIHAMQLMLSFALGKPFAGLAPNRKLAIWYIQSEDSPTRLSIDRTDATAELAELWPDATPEVLGEAWRRVRIVPQRGVGAEFLADIAMKLETARNYAMSPDLLVINPFLAIVGGPITDGAFVTPFLRGGRINGAKTDGFQHILEQYELGALIYHHTPKPPTDKEIAAWLKSPFPEYQGAGSSDITNWGRSFITMMRVQERPQTVCLTAGKNGADLGWDYTDGAYRLYMAWSKSKGVTGRTRHAWRELDENEMAEISKPDDHAAEDALVVANVLKACAQRYKDLAKTNAGLSRNRFRSAWNIIKIKFADYGLAAFTVILGVNENTFYGTRDEARAKAEEAAQNFKNARNLDEAPVVTECRGADGVPPHSAPHFSDGGSSGVRMGSTPKGVQSQSRTPDRNDPTPNDPQDELTPKSLIEDLQI
jgi:hypothetical protein